MRGFFLLTYSPSLSPETKMVSCEGRAHIYYLKLVPGHAPSSLLVKTLSESFALLGVNPWLGDRKGLAGWGLGVAGVPSYSHRDPTRSLFPQATPRGTGPSSSPGRPPQRAFPAAVPALCSRGRHWHTQEAASEGPSREVTQEAAQGHRGALALARDEGRGGSLESEIRTLRCSPHRETIPLGRLPKKIAREL